MTRLRWWWRRWRADHYALAAWLDWYDQPTEERRHAYARAVDYRARVRADRP